MGGTGPCSCWRPWPPASHRWRRPGAFLDGIEHDVSGWLVPPEDPAALARGLDCLLASSELRRRLGPAPAGRSRSVFPPRSPFRHCLGVYAQFVPEPAVDRAVPLPRANVIPELIGSNSKVDLDFEFHLPPLRIGLLVSIGSLTPTRWVTGSSPRSRLPLARNCAGGAQRWDRPASTPRPPPAAQLAVYHDLLYLLYRKLDERLFARLVTPSSRWISHCWATASTSPSVRCRRNTRLPTAGGFAAIRGRSGRSPALVRILRGDFSRSPAGVWSYHHGAQRRQPRRPPVSGR